MSRPLARLTATLAAICLLATACSPAATPATTTTAANPTVAAVAPTIAAPTPATAPTAATVASPSAAPAAAPAAQPTVSTAPVTITLWHGMQAVQEATLKSLVEDYKKVRPNVTINLDYTSYSASALQQKIMAGIAAQQMPDIAQAFPNDTAAWIDAGVIISLDDYVKGPSGLSQADLDDLFPSLWREGTMPQFQNKQYAVPFNKSLDGVIVYNMDVLKAAGYEKFPATWDEFEAMCGKLPSGVTCFSVQPSASRDMIQIYAHGGEVLASTLKSAAFGPSIQRWFDREKSIIDKKFGVVVRDFSWQNDFAAGRLAAGATTSAGDSFIADLVKDSFQYGFAPMPGATAAAPFSISGTNLVMFKSNADRQAAAWEFMKWVMQKEQSVKWATATGYLPLRKSAAADPVFRDFLTRKPRFNVLMDALPVARSEPPLAAWPEIRGFLSDAENKVVGGSATPAAATEELVTKSNAALSR